jgi:predicted transglutaminase-like cysteine proteinase
LDLRLLSAAFLVLLLLGTAPLEASELFGLQEIYSTDLAPFTKWDGVVARVERERADGAAICAIKPAGQACVAEWWRNFIAELARLPLRERVAKVNLVLNRVPYVTAQANWHDPDHWETPYEFLTRGGQCQDYAIAKFMALEQSGVPQEALRLAVVRDTQKGADHAVAIVYVDGAALVLDNQNQAVVPASPHGRYRPYYSINRAGWWYSVPETASTMRVARSGAGSALR